MRGRLRERFGGDGQADAGCAADDEDGLGGELGCGNFGGLVFASNGEVVVDVGINCLCLLSTSLFLPDRRSYTYLILRLEIGNNRLSLFRPSATPSATARQGFKVA